MFFNVQSCVPCLHRPESLEPKTEGGPLKGSPRSSASLDSKESASFLSSPVSDSSLDDGGKAADADRLVKELKSQASSVGVPQKMVNLKEAKTCLEEALKEALEKTHIVNPFVDYIWVMPLTDFKPSVSEETVSRVIEEAVKVIDAVESGIMSSDGIENCVPYIHNFDPEKSKNPFAYFTQIIHYAFLRRIQKEKKQLEIKTKIIEKTGYDEVMMVDDSLLSGSSSDYNSIKDAITYKNR